MSRIAIRSTGSCLGEEEASVSELVSVYQAPEQVIRRSLGNRTVRVTRGPIEALALRAATVCLQRASVAAEEVDAIIWGGPAHDAMHFQKDLGAVQATTFMARELCSEFPSALYTAKCLVRDGYRHVLVASASTLRSDPNSPLRTDVVVPACETGYCELLSDAGSAALVVDGEGLELCGFGAATGGNYWDYYLVRRRLAEGGAPPSAIPNDLEMLKETRPIHQRALHECLAKAGVTVDQIDHFVLPLELGTLSDSYARWMLGLPPSKVFHFDGCSHVGFSDLALGLDVLSRSGTLAGGQYVLLVGRAVGVVRCAILRS